MERILVPLGIGKQIDDHDEVLFTYQLSQT